MDAFSDCGRYALTLIAFIGSVFSPYYAAARRRGPADPSAHCALNAVLYGHRGKRWAMTERGADALRVSSGRLQIGPSVLAWRGDALVVDIDEITVPFPSRLQGRVTLHAGGFTEQDYALDAAGRHRWWPAAPVARVEVAMAQPRLRWQGHAYFDSNGGSEPLEQAFRHWHWSRRSAAAGESTVYYAVCPRQGAPRELALRFDAAGRVTPLEPPASRRLPATPVWCAPRATLAAVPVAVKRTLEDTPFYARSILLEGADRIPAMHESLSLERFSRRWVQCLLPFRMPRRGSA